MSVCPLFFYPQKYAFSSETPWRWEDRERYIEKESKGDRETMKKLFMFGPPIRKLNYFSIEHSVH
jgi:hypothetical protein